MTPEEMRRYQERSEAEFARINKELQKFQKEHTPSKEFRRMVASIRKEQKRQQDWNTLMAKVVDILARK